jgi:hypothetical protein
MVKCQDCKHLKKMPYIEARPSHHENWFCKSDGTTHKYEDTVAIRECSRFDKKVKKVG